MHGRISVPAPPIRRPRAPSSLTNNAGYLDGRSAVQGRSAHQIIEVCGQPFSELAEGRHLIKIDAEGIEAELLAAARDVLNRMKPVLVVEVLPEAHRLAALLRDIAREWHVPIHVVPAYGSDNLVVVEPEAFSAADPVRYRSKDIILGALPESAVDG